MFHSVAGLVAPVKAATARPAPTKAKAKPPAPATPAPEPAPQAGPLGLRYSILKEAGPSQTAEVDPETTFRSGDRIRLTIESNDNAHLYIVQRGSSGNWSLLFPSPEIAKGNNLIERGRHYEIPPGHWFAFDEQAGKERVFIVLSRQPEPNLEQMIYAIRQDENRSSKTLLAQDRPITDAVVNRVRSQVLTRDLVFEKVDEKTAGGKSEKAVYVVNKAAAPDARVVTDLTLNHQ